VPTSLDVKDFCSQRVPTLRLHFPGNITVGESHADGDYNRKASDRLRTVEEAE